MNQHPKALAIVLSLLAYGHTSAQEQIAPYPNVNIISPTASSLGKFVDFPVNLHTGVPEINIPIYTVREGPLALPISLAYHASGLKVLEPASWVGAGWALNAGGVVSRTVKGLPDEKVGYDNYSFFSDKGYSQYFLDENGYTDYASLLIGHKDPEPDIFTFNFGNYSGKFYFREDQTPILLPHGDLKIEPIVKPGPNTFSVYDYIQGFKITTPDGTKYYFGVTSAPDDVDPIEKSTIKNGGDLAFFPSVVSSWYLHRVESHDGQFGVNLSYREEDYGFFTISTRPCVPNCDNSVMPAKVLISGVSLEKITFTGGAVDFIVAGDARLDLSGEDFVFTDDANTQAKALAAINISATQDDHCVSYAFSYDYFTDTSNLPVPYVLAQWNTAFLRDKKRLKLEEIQMTSCDTSVVVPPYVFHYYAEQEVPRRISMAQDHWGFYNGATSNANLLPPVSANDGVTYYPGDDRDANWPAMRAGSLRMVEYPTGGGTQYVYAPNSTSTVSNCVFQQSPSVSFAVNAGMASADAGFGPAYSLTVHEPSTYYYILNAMGSGASGHLYVDNTRLASVHANQASVADYIVLAPGTYSFRAYANSDNGSGVGVLGSFYTATTSCDPPAEKIVGGLRIQRIDKFGTNDSPKLSRTYNYEGANLYSIPIYIFKLKNEFLKTGLIPNGTENGCKVDAGAALTYYSPSSTQPMQDVNGYHIGYTKVTENSPNGAKTVHAFKGTLKLPGGWHTVEDICVRKVDASVCSMNDPVYPPPPLPYDFERGHLKSQIYLDNDDKKIREVTFLEEYVEDPLGVFGVVVGSYPESGTTLVSHYDVRSAKLNWSKQIEKNFDEGENFQATEATTYFSSPYHRMVTRKTSTSDKGLTSVDYRYAPDLTECNTECPSCAEAYLAAATTLLSEYNVKDENCKIGGCTDLIGWSPPLDPCASLSNCRACAWIDYQYRLNQARIAYTNCINTCKQNNTCINDGISATGNADVKALYQMENVNQLNLVEVASWLNENFLSATFLQHLPDETPPASVYLRNIYTTEHTGSTEAFQPVAISAGILERDVKYETLPASSYVHDGGQLVEIRPRNGIVTSYIWAQNNTVPIVKADGIAYGDLLQAYNASPEDLRTSVYTLHPSASVTTYTHHPITGITTATDANGRTTSYEYDGLGRLVRVKDHEGKVLEQHEYTYGIQQP